MTVRDVLGSRSQVFSVMPDTTVLDAARYLRDCQVRAAAVISPGGNLVGVLSQSDVSDKVTAENRCPAWTRVSEVMSTRLIVVTPDESLEDCMRLMEHHGIYHLLVVDRRGAYWGMVSVRDLLNLIALDERARADMLEAFVSQGRTM